MQYVSLVLMNCALYPMQMYRSLSGGGGGAGGENPANEGGNVERIVPENDMTDEEVTMMAMRNAQFRNSDVAIEEVYGKPREEEDGEGEFQ